MSILNDPSILGPVISGLRIANLIAWGLVGGWGTMSIFRLIFGPYDWRDLMWSALALLAFALTIGNVRAIAHVVPPATDQWTFITLLSLMLSAAGIFIARAFQAPDGHKRAALLSHLTLLMILVVAGML